MTTLIIFNYFTDDDDSGSSNGEDYQFPQLPPCGGNCMPSNLCFPGSSQVRLATGESRPMADLKTGDSIMTIVDGKLTPTAVLGFMFKICGMGNYLTIHTEDGTPNDSSFRRQACFVTFDINAYMHVNKLYTC